MTYDFPLFHLSVSTHSRAKAAGFEVQTEEKEGSGFNTQPREGGWRFNPDCR